MQHHTNSSHFYYRPKRNSLQELEKSSDTSHTSQSQTSNLAARYKPINEQTCLYCELDDLDYLVKCLVCKSWFCNNYNESRKSDIYAHLHRSKHNTIGLYRREDKKTNVVMCITCPETNIFKLSVVLLSNKVLIYCRECFIGHQASLGDPESTLIVEENRLSYHLVKVSPTAVIYEPRYYPDQQIQNMAGRNIDDTEAADFKIKDVFDSVEDYFVNFKPIVEAEEKEDKKVRGNWQKSGVQVRWIEEKYKILGILSCPNEEDSFGSHLNPGGQIEVGNKYWCGKGLIKYVNDEEVCFILKRDSRIAMNMSEVTVKSVWTNVTFSRMETAIDAILDKETPKISENLFDLILDPSKIMKNEDLINEEAQQTNIDFLLDSKLQLLNDYQMEAATIALNENSPLTLIQGPPGTGKTVTLVAITYMLVQQLRTAKSSKRILVCAPSNIAVDSLALELAKNNVRVCRIYSRTREAAEIIDGKIEPISLHTQVRKLHGDQFSRLRELQSKKDDHVWLPWEEEKEYIALKKEAEDEILKNIEIVCCTCITSGDPRFDNYSFPYVVMDEAAQALEPEGIIPFIHKAQKVILAGDHKQLGPLVNSLTAKKAGLSRSLFERLAEKSKPYVLQLQYRMHPEIAAFSSEQFYERKLETSNTVKQSINKDMPWPNKTKPMLFYHINGREEIPASGISLMNREESGIVQRFVELIINRKVNPENIGVITPYTGQKMHLHRIFKLSPSLSKIKIASVDGFQGQEKEYIVISCVRSNKEIGIGFLADERRLNVALTRAKYGLIIIGNARLLSNSKIWNELLKGYENNGILVEGDLNDLKPISLTVPVISQEELVNKSEDKAGNL